MNRKLNNWLWTDVTHRIAVWLICAGATRQPWILRTLMVTAPSLIGLAMALEEVYRPSNSITWIFEPKHDGDFNELLIEVNEIIERAPTPFGKDNFIIVIERRVSLPDDGVDLSFERVEATLDQRALLEQVVLRGNRWSNWKRGNSKQELLDALAKTIPTMDASVTLIRAAVMGNSMARLAARVS